MKLKLAKNNIDDENKSISQKEIEKQMTDKDSTFIYLDNGNLLKDIQKLKTALEKNLKSVYFNKIKYGIDKDSFLYEMHIINNKSKNNI